MEPSAEVMDDVLPRARKLNRDAVEQLLRTHYPRVSRVAMALCGDEAAGQRVTRVVMQQSLSALPWWSNETEAGNWFLHHTVLTSREYSIRPVEISRDCLVATLKNPSPDHVAFVKALRLLPMQQREAFLLFRAEHLDPRATGVAMDCSMGAAENHRIAAEKALSEVAAATFPERTAELVRVYATMTPGEALIVGDVSRIAAALTVRKSKSVLTATLMLGIIAIIAWGAWQLWRMVEI